MASSNSIPRFLLPRAQFLLRPGAPLPRPAAIRLSARHASNAPPARSKPMVLEKPEKFNPPSHGRRLPKGPPRTYGPNLTAEQKEKMATKKYPHMMAPKNSFMYKVLTDKWLHTFISLGILVALGSFAFWVNFLRTTPYADMLPSKSDLKSHPWDSFWRFVEVYKMHVAYISAETAERRRKKVEDVTKRSEYRKAHGLDNEQGFGGWTAKSDAEVLGPGIRAGDRVVVDEASPVAQEPAGGAYPEQERPKKPLKKWLGIW